MIVLQLLNDGTTLVRLRILYCAQVFNYPIFGRDPWRAHQSSTSFRGRIGFLRSHRLGKETTKLTKPKRLMN